MKIINLLLESFICILVVWISFFPSPVHQEFHLITKAFLMLAFILLLTKKHISVFRKAELPLWLFLVCIGINVLFAQQKDIALKVYLDLAIPMFLIYYLISRGLSFGPKFNLLVKTVCICSSIVALGGILEMLFAFNPIYEHLIENPYYERFVTGFVHIVSSSAHPRFVTGFVHPISTQFHPTVLGSYLLGCLPFNFLLYRESRDLFKLLAAASLILGISVIILTFSRTVFFGLAAMIGFYLFMNRKYKLIPIFAIIVFIFVSLCTFLPHPFDRYGIRIMAGENEGILSSYKSTRHVMVQRIIRDHPLVGLGLKHFRIRFYEYYPKKGKVPNEFMVADNMYLTILSETGIVGFTGFLILFFSIFKKARRRLDILDHSPQQKQQLLASLTAFTGSLFVMVGYESFYWPSQYMYFCLLIGALGIQNKIKEG